MTQRPRPLAFCCLCILMLALGGCDQSPSKTTDTRSDTMTHEQRVAFVEQYVTFKRAYDTLWFHIVFHDNSAGLIPGPSDWDIQVVAKVPIASMDDWIPQTPNQKTAKLEWVSNVSTEATPARFKERYSTNVVDVGVDRTTGFVAYRNTTLR